MLENILQFDTELLIYLNQLGCLQYDAIWLAISHKLTWIPLYAYLLFLVIKNFGLKKSGAVIIMVAITFFFTDFMVTQVYRPFFHRLRPCNIPELADQLRLVKAHCGGKFGYFSAHASNTMGLAVFIGNVLYEKHPKLWKYLIPWAIVVGYSRIYLGVHYPLDILSGFIYGATIGTLVYMVFKKMNIQVILN